MVTICQRASYTSLAVQFVCTSVQRGHAGTYTPKSEHQRGSVPGNVHIADHLAGGFG